MELVWLAWRRVIIFTGNTGNIRKETIGGDCEKTNT